MKNKGQALVEFIIILPIFIVMLLGIIDFGSIFYKKNYLENVLEEVTEMYKKEKSIEKIEEYLNDIDSKISFLYEISDNDSIDIKLEYSYVVITPGLNIILDNPYQIKVSRVIYNG